MAELLHQAAQSGDLRQMISNLVLIPAGRFRMGQEDGRDEERPVHWVTVDPFRLSRYHVTNADYDGFRRATGREATPFRTQAPFARLDQPVVGVSWFDAVDYCSWLTAELGCRFRLPTEAEWERACRGYADGKVYPWGDDRPTAQLARFNALDGPCAVGRFKPSYFGLYDLAGNVWEWCADWYEREYYERAPDRNPAGPAEGSYRVLRGGSWADEPKYLTCAYRSWARPAERSPNIGFRCARSIR
jgi:formylglycine-generating enzyme required for sulfatase activity